VRAHSLPPSAITTSGLFPLGQESKLVVVQQGTDPVRRRPSRTIRPVGVHWRLSS
jgi:hypothetical protein